MELFSKTKAVKLRSHLDKYLIADDDQETVRQSKSGSLRRAIWLVELVQNKPYVIRLKSCYGKYLTASDIPFLLGMTGNKVFQRVPENETDWMIVEWEPVSDGFQFKFKSWCGKFLRANGGTPPWRNSLTHDEPHAGSTKNWILWDVEAADVPETGSFLEYLSSVSSINSVSDDVLEVFSDGAMVSGAESPMSVMSSPMKRSIFSILSMHSPRFSSKKTVSKFNEILSGMDFFQNAKVVRLRSHHDKFLIADDDDGDSVAQDRNVKSKYTKWTVEVVPESQNLIRLKSCDGKYLTASNQQFLLGMTGRKVTRSLPRKLDSSVEWEPIREGNRVKLKTRYGHFLRANGGLPPWRNSVTHDIPHRTATQDWILWDVHVVEIQVLSPKTQQKQQEAPSPSTNSHSDSLDFESSSPSSVSLNSGKFSRQGSDDSFVESHPKSEGRTIYYHVVDETGEEFDHDSSQWFAVTFKGNGVDELTQKLAEELGNKSIVVCSLSPLNGKLYPLRLQLPPNNADMHVIVVPSGVVVQGKQR